MGIAGLAVGAAVYQGIALAQDINRGGGADPARAGLRDAFHKFFKKRGDNDPSPRDPCEDVRTQCRWRSQGMPRSLVRKLLPSRWLPPLTTLVEKLLDFETITWSGSSRSPPSLPASTRAIQGHVRRLVSLGDPSSIDIDLALPSVAFLAAEAPYLVSADGLFLLPPEDPRHRTLRAAWAEGLEKWADTPAALMRGCAFYLPWNCARAGELVERLLGIAPVSWEANLTAGEYFFQAADQGSDEASYALAAKHLLAGCETERLFVWVAPQAAMAILETGDSEEAADLARGALEKAPSWDTVGGHLAHSVIGRVALIDDDEKLALVEFEASMQGRWGRWGPSMRLARELGNRGHENLVVKFIQEISSSWRGPSKRCEQWLRLARSGEFSELHNAGR